jgi:transposase
MATDGPTFDQWLREAKIERQKLADRQLAVLEAGFRFLESRGRDYYSLRLLSHFLLHCQAGLKVAQVARLVGVSRPTASEQQELSSKEVVQAAHHRMAGRPHGKLLPRYAGPIAQFLCTHPKASRLDVLDFIEATWDVRVSKVALWRFLKKYGLDGALGSPRKDTAAEPRVGEAQGVPEVVPLSPSSEFFLASRTTQAPSCLCRRPSTGLPPPRIAFRTDTARCGGDC